MRAAAIVPAYNEAGRIGDVLRAIAASRLVHEIIVVTDGCMEGEVMSLTAIIVFLIVGAVAGWLAGQIVKGRGFGLVGNIVVGIIGAVIAGFLLPMAGLEIGGGMVASIINAVIGAVILLVIISFVRKTA